MTQKNVLILSTLFPGPIHRYRGTFVEEQALALARLASVTVIAPIGFPLSPRKHHRREREQARTVPLVEMKEGLQILRPRYLGLPWHLDRFNVYPILMAALHLIRSHRLDFDIIHAHSVASNGYVAMLLGRMFHKPVVVTVHGFCVNVLLRAEDKMIYGALAKALDSSAARRRTVSALTGAQLVITVSDELGEKIRRTGITPQRMVTIRNGVNTGRFKPVDTRKVRQQLNIPLDARVILFVGSLSSSKRPVFLVRSFADLLASVEEKALLIMVGDGEQRDSIENLIRQHRLESHVRLVGTKAPSEIPLWMNACDVFVLPTLYESFGCVLLEALACGKPVVTTRVGGIPEYIRHGEHGFLVEPNDTEALTHAIHQAMNMPWPADQLIAFAEQNLWDAIAQQISAEYDRLPVSL